MLTLHHRQSAAPQTGGSLQAGSGTLPLAVIAVLCLTRCSPPAQRIQLPTMVMSAADKRGSLRVESYDAAQLFTEAARLHEAGELEQAIKLYRRVITEFPRSAQVPYSHFNAGLCLMQRGEPRQAAQHLEAALQHPIADRDRISAWLHLASCFTRLEQWSDVASWATKAARHTQSSIVQRVEARARRAYAFEMQGRMSQAERDCLWVLGMSRRPEHHGVLQLHDAVSRCAFRIGEMARIQAERIKLLLPREKMSNLLTQKGTLVLKAQSYYIRAIRHLHPYWSTAAGYHLGLLYEGFYRDCLSAQVPSGLTEQQREGYYEELRRLVRPVIEKATIAHEKNLEMAYRLDVSNEWVAKSEKALGRLSEILKKQGWQPK